VGHLLAVSSNLSLTRSVCVVSYGWGDDFPSAPFVHILINSGRLYFFFEYHWSFLNFAAPYLLIYGSFYRLPLQSFTGNEQQSVLQQFKKEVIYASNFRDTLLLDERQLYINFTAKI